MTLTQISDYITIRDFASKIDQPIVKVLAVLMRNGLNVTINDTIDYETAEIIADEFGISLERAVESHGQAQQEQVIPEDSSKLVTRPPIVTIMGHVDHGKTSLLDHIRKTAVADTEAGGITQNITAYQVNISVYDQDRKITFIDTPGHKAFSAMREHGSGITDIVILVVAMDDGVKPQTIEVIDYVKQNNIPCIVALNKSDVVGADSEKVKRQLSEHELTPSEWGGKTVMIPVSAKKGDGIKDLLENIILLADELNLRANYEHEARGVVVESHQQKGLGAVALLLVTDGVLRKNHVILFGNCFGKIRILENTLGKEIDCAEPSTPVRIAGLKTLPEFGDFFSVVKTEKEAKSLMGKQSSADGYLIKSAQKDNQRKVLNLIVKAETKGTLNAFCSGIKELENEQVMFKFNKIGIGNVTESDLDLAQSTHAKLVAFRVQILPQIAKSADNYKISIMSSHIIYELLDQLKEMVAQNTEKIYKPLYRGKLKILAVFFAKGSKQVIGGEVVDGTITRECKVKLLREKEELGEGKIETLEREKTAVDEVKQGSQCGMSIELDAKAKQGDIIEAYTLEEVK